MKETYIDQFIRDNACTRLDSLHIKGFQSFGKLYCNLESNFSLATAGYFIIFFYWTEDKYYLKFFQNKSDAKNVFEKIKASVQTSDEFLTQEAAFKYYLDMYAKEFLIF